MTREKADYQQHPERATFSDQAEHDKKMLAETLADRHPHNSLEKKWALARLLFFIHYAQAEFRLQEGHLVPTFGIAPTESLLCHTQRVIVSMTDAPTSWQVISWLMTGDIQNMPCKDFFAAQIRIKKLSLERDGAEALTYFNRRAGTHDLISTSDPAFPVLEVKSFTHGAASAVSSIFNTITNHWGMNIGIGREGRDDGQFGHVYLNIKELQDHKYAFQVGIESSAPLKRGPAGQVHGVSGRASDTAITGGVMLHQYSELPQQLKGTLPRRNAIYVRNMTSERFAAITREFATLERPSNCIKHLAQSPYNYDPIFHGNKIPQTNFSDAWVENELKSPNPFDRTLEKKINELTKDSMLREQIKKKIAQALEECAYQLIPDHSNEREVYQLLKEKISMILFLFDHVTLFSEQLRDLILNKFEAQYLNNHIIENDDDLQQAPPLNEPQENDDDLQHAAPLNEPQENNQAQIESWGKWSCRIFGRFSQDIISKTIQVGTLYYITDTLTNHRDEVALDWALMLKLAASSVVAAGMIFANAYTPRFRH